MRRGNDDGAYFEEWFAECSVEKPKHGIHPEKHRAISMLAFEAGRRAPAPPCPFFTSWARYGVHNLVGHPVMWMLGVAGMRRAALWVHERTLPRNVRGLPLRQAIEAGELFKCS